jgi:hypothetical protein
MRDSILLSVVIALLARWRAAADLSLSQPP